MDLIDFRKAESAAKTEIRSFQKNQEKYLVIGIPLWIEFSQKLKKSSSIIDKRFYPSCLY